MDYLPIQSLDIEAEKQITFDLFLHFPLNDRVIRYRKKGGALESARLDRFLEKDLQNFWIKKDDFREFVQYVANRLRVLIDTGDSIENRQMMTAAAKSILTSSFSPRDSAMSMALMTNLSEITQVLIENILEDIAPARKKSFRKLMELASEGSDFHKHPVNVASISVLIAYGVGYSTDQILADVAMGALLHDAGLAKLPIEISGKAHEPLLLSRDERRELYRHCEYGIALLEEKKMAVSEIMRAIVTQHHEQFNGSGYPMGLRGYMVNEFAQIVRVADDLDHLARQPDLDAQKLRKQIIRLFNELGREKVIEPNLASRIRKLFLDS